MCEVSDPNQVAKTVNEWPSYLNNSLLEVLKNSFNFEKMTPVQVNILFSRVSIHKDILFFWSTLAQT
jgi:hypothetical protein